MKKIETICGYDIYELTKEECEKRWYEYPTFAVFYEGEDYDTTQIEETTEGTIEDARRWCREYEK